MKYIKEFRVIDIQLGVGCSTHSIYLKEHNDKLRRWSLPYLLVIHFSRGQSPTQGSNVLFVGNIDYG